ncbi:hypothetical protein B296_00019481 [Ensete ventricosum]|uniref:Uncharacterized protein n=1 Tax=Ensete ventricosum TaxID=4639 RepID=A0A426XVS5_ENSVE|nr:hypothetical protein B296_00019481 [Ensete ventricosum]
MLPLAAGYHHSPRATALAGERCHLAQPPGPQVTFLRGCAHRRPPLQVALAAGGHSYRGLSRSRLPLRVAWPWLGNPCRGLGHPCRGLGHGQPPL